uniref:Uncharacterized protein n=1 Tax=Arundo donax TaxID=35708 RepID=A0A0A9EI64_ARUDO
MWSIEVYWSCCFRLSLCCCWCAGF